MNEKSKVPTHVAFIMDGNGRWAKSKLKPRSFGHKAGMERMIGLCEYAKKAGIKYITLYALSTENMNRPKEELNGLYSLFENYFSQNVESLIKNGCAVKIIGDILALPNNIQTLILNAEKSSPQEAEFTVIIALNYGARAEILRAVNAAVESGEKLSEESFSNLLYTNGVPYPDLIIRTGKEKRLSNFLLWQAAYAELYFCDTLFPDFTDEEFQKALLDYAARERRYGKL